MMGRLPRGRFGVDWGKVRRQAREALDQTGAQYRRERHRGRPERRAAAGGRDRPGGVCPLPGPDPRRSHELALRGGYRATHGDLEQLRSQGVAVVFVSHRLREVFQVRSSRATVLRDGRLVDTGDLSGITESALVTKMVGRTMEDLYGKRSIPKGDVILSVRNLSTWTGR